MRSFHRMRRPLGVVLSVILTGSLTTVIAPGTAVAADGPSVPLPEVPSVPGTVPTMDPRPPDQAATSALSGNQPTVTPPGGGGTSTATSLSPSASWNVSAQSGDFSWSYPLRVPPAPGGLEPNLALSYRSSAVDGRTSATNNQASWVGDGWDLSPGFVERTYGACAEDDGGGTVAPQTGDLCWRSDNATASFGGGGGMLVRDDTTGTWRSKNDNGARVERLTGASNGDDNGEHWRITTVDGTQYLFGSQPSSSSTWTVPVFGDDANEPCHAAQFDDSHCVQAYRWNLDKVIDRNGNVIRYFYQTESNNYGMNLQDTAVSYIRGGTLERIEYGLRDDLPNSPAAGRVQFTTADRCVKNSTCAVTEEQNWPDTPLKERCTGATCADKHAPTFWSTKRLATVTTQVWRGTEYADVDRWALGHEFPDPGDGEKAALWLRTVTHTGLAGTNPVSLPAVTFEGTKMANRVYLPDGAGWLNRYRITGIVSETGGVISVVYAPPNCGEGNLPTAPESNTQRCFPARWVKEDWAERTDYFHKYVVAQVTVSDRLSTSVEQTTSYEYLDGAAWHWDTSEFVKDDKKTWNEFRGFARVRVRTGTDNDPAGPVSMVEQRFFRGMNGDRLPSGTRSVQVTDSTGTSYPDHDWLHGFGLETTAYNGVTGPVVSKSITEPWWHGPTATRGQYKAYLVRPGVQRGYTALAAGGWRTTRTETTYDTHGQPTRTNDLGDTATAADDRCTRTTYVPNTTKWLLSLPSTTETVSVHCGQTAQFPEHALGATRTSYDGQAPGAAPTTGNPTKTEIANTRPATGPVFATVATATYDTHGRVRTATDALGNTTTTAYTPTTGGPLTQTKVTTPPTLGVPAGMVTTTTIDPAFGAPTKVVDPNGRRTEITYDALGRKTEVWLTNRRREYYPDGNLKFEYHLRNDAPSAITTRSVGANGLYVTSNEVFDGLLRKRQVQAPAVGGGRLLTDIRYDSHGRAYKATQPYYNDAPIDTQLWEAADTEIPAQTQTEFDGAGRPVAQAFKHGATEKWRTSIAYGGDRTHVTPPAGATPTTTITDAHGRTTELRQYAADTPTGAYDSTTYTYNPAGQLATVTDPGNNTWEYGYDLRGRTTTTNDPDKGASTYQYDNAGQLTATTDARGVTLAYAYDALGRRTATHEGSLTGTKLAEWQYDTAWFGKGYPASSTRWTNGHPYTVTIDGYSGLYQADLVIVSIPQVEGDLAGNYEWQGSFNSDGTLSGESYPAAGNLPRETVNYTQDDWGRLLSSSGAHNGTVELVTNTTYTRYGEPERVSLGTGTRAWLSYLYEDDTRRLERTVVDAEVPNPIQADLHYTYDPAGNITSVADTPTGLPQDTQCFRYDHLRRLTEAWTPTTTCDPDPTTAALSGPAPYWHSYTYDKTGNRLTETQHDAAGDTTRTYAYTGHQLNSVTTTAPGATTLDEYAYDQAGNTTTRNLAGEQQDLNWDPEGRLSWVNQNNETTSFVYDADGNRLIRRDPTGATLYLGKQEVQWTQSTNTTTTTRYYTHGGNGPKIATRQGSKLYWLAADHNGTAQITINNTTMEVNHRRHLPFGQPRGTTPTFWPGQQGFVGGTQDPTTGLTHLGAREYDPTLGRFISVDPLMDLGDPQQIHGYTYSNNNPITFTDPDGLKHFEGDQSGGIDAGACKDGNCGKAPPTSAQKQHYQAQKKLYSYALGKKPSADLMRGLEGLGYQGTPDFSWADALAFAGESEANSRVVCQLIKGNVDECKPDVWNWDGVAQGLERAANFAYQLTPVSDAINCIGGDGESCVWLAAAAIPATRLLKAAKACSFTGDTHVLMADGTTKPIEDIDVGDQVRATNPETGQSGARTVAAVWHHPDTVLNLVTADGATVTTTGDHPFWNATDQQWQQAQQLDPGDHLLAADGGTVSVAGLRISTARLANAYNLTVKDIHSYYVLAGKEPVLVHNSDGCAPETLIHYTDEAGMNGILKDGKLNASTKETSPTDVRYGDGQYLSDIAPGSITCNQLSRCFLGHPFSGRRFTHYVRIDVRGLKVVKGRRHVYVIPNRGPLDLNGRIASYGVN